MSNHSNLKPDDKKMIRKHLDRYNKSCIKDSTLRIPRMVNNAIDYVDMVDSNYIDNDLYILDRVDYFDIKNRYGGYVADVYDKLLYPQQVRMLQVIDSINALDISSSDKKRRIRKYVLTCNLNAIKKR